MGIYLLGFLSGILVYSLYLLVYYCIKLRIVNKRIKENEAKIRNLQLLKENLRRFEEADKNRTV